MKKRVSTVINIEEALQRTSNDISLLEELFTIILNQIPKQLDLLDKAYMEKNGDAIRMTAHNIKGAAGNIGAESIMNAAFAMEQAGINNKLNEYEKLKKRLLNCFKKFKQYIHSGKWKK